MSAEKILTTFLAGFFTFILPYQAQILALFCLVLINAVARIIAVINDDDIKLWQIFKILNRSNSISYVLYSLTGYSLAISSVVLLEISLFDGISIAINDNEINLTYLTILFCITHTFNEIYKSVEDIVKHDLLSKIKDRIPNWLREIIKDEKTKKDTN